MQILSACYLFLGLCLYVLVGHLGAKISDAESFLGYVQ